MNKIVITIQGKTLILHYQVKPGLVRNGSGWETYIEVLPSAELSRFNLKGLTPEMFCVNISDMVNIHGLFSAAVENEKQIPVAQFELDQDDYLKAISNLTVKFTHLQLVNMLEPLPGYVQEADNEFIDFEEKVVPHSNEAFPENDTFSGYRLTIVTEDTGDKVAPFAYYNLDVYTSGEWQGYPPPQAHYETLRLALAKKLEEMSNAGVHLTQIHDETDYAVAMESPD